MKRDCANVLVTDLVPSEMACLASSPGRMRRTDVWISRDEMVDFLEYAASSKMLKRQSLSLPCLRYPCQGGPANQVRVFQWTSAQTNSFSSLL